MLFLINLSTSDPISMLEKKEIFRKVEGIIHELDEQYKYLSKNQDSLNELELELFAANAIYLSEHIKIIRRLNIEKGQPLPEKTKVAGEALPSEVRTSQTPEAEEHDTKSASPQKEPAETKKPEAKHFEPDFSAPDQQEHQKD